MKSENTRLETPGDYGEKLDNARNEIARLLESGAITVAAADRLGQREKALRYQVRQLGSATERAKSDIQSGLRLSWEEFQHALEQHNVN